MHPDDQRFAGQKKVSDITLQTILPERYVKDGV